MPRRKRTRPRALLRRYRHRGLAADVRQLERRIRNYGGGGWVGGGHRYADQIGSKAPAIVNANLGYASGTTDAGQPWYQDASFALLLERQGQRRIARDFSVRAMVEQAVKTKALVNLYYGKAPKYAYYDGHSQGGRQGMKIAQEYPELYDGYMIAQPALSIAEFGTSGLYPQIVMKAELGYAGVDKAEAAAFAAEVAAANARAVAACDKPGLGFLLDPFACDYDPARDAAALCTGVAGDGVTGSNADAATCMSAKEAKALNRIWYGATPDGSLDAARRPTPQRQALGARSCGGRLPGAPRSAPDHERSADTRVGAAGRQLCRRRQRHIGHPITNGSTMYATNGSSSIMPDSPTPSTRLSRCSRRCSAISSPTRPIWRSCAISAAR